MGEKSKGYLTDVSTKGSDFKVFNNGVKKWKFNSSNVCENTAKFSPKLWKIV